MNEETKLEEEKEEQERAPGRVMDIDVASAKSCEAVTGMWLSLASITGMCHWHAVCFRYRCTSI